MRWAIPHHTRWQDQRHWQLRPQRQGWRCTQRRMDSDGRRRQQRDMEVWRRNRESCQHQGCGPVGAQPIAGKDGRSTLDRELPVASRLEEAFAQKRTRGRFMKKAIWVIGIMLCLASSFALADAPDGTYRLVMRKLADGTVLPPPAVHGMGTFKD